MDEVVVVYTTSAKKEDFVAVFKGGKRIYHATCNPDDGDLETFVAVLTGKYPEPWCIDLEDDQDARKATLEDFKKWMEV